MRNDRHTYRPAGWAARDDQALHAQSKKTRRTTEIHTDTGISCTLACNHPPFHLTPNCSLLGIEICQVQAEAARGTSCTSLHSPPQQNCQRSPPLVQKPWPKKPAMQAVLPPSATDIDNSTPAAAAALAPPPSAHQHRPSRTLLPDLHTHYRPGDASATSD